MVPSDVTVWAAMNTSPTVGEGNGVSAGSAARAAVARNAAAPNAAPSSRIFLMIPPRGQPLLGERALELDAEGARTPVVHTGELEGAGRLVELAGGLRDLRLAGHAEDLARLVAAAGRAGDDGERELAALAGHRSGTCERNARLHGRVARTRAGDLHGADARATGGAVGLLVG